MQDASPVAEMVAALASERAGALRANRADKVITIDEQLALRGYCVGQRGDLVEVDFSKKDERPKKPARPRRETAARGKAPEKAVDAD